MEIKDIVKQCCENIRAKSHREDSALIVAQTERILVCFEYMESLVKKDKDILAVINGWLEIKNLPYANFHQALHEVKNLIFNPDDKLTEALKTRMELTVARMQIDILLEEKKSLKKSVSELSKKLMEYEDGYDEEGF